MKNLQAKSYFYMALNLHIAVGICGANWTTLVKKVFSIFNLYTLSDRTKGRFRVGETRFIIGYPA